MDTQSQGQTDHCGSVAIATRLFFENAWLFKDIFREFEAFVKIKGLLKDIFREI
jgi:hypothetical protein